MELSDLYQADRWSNEYQAAYTRDWRAWKARRITRIIINETNLVNISEEELFTKRDLEYLCSINSCFLFGKKEKWKLQEKI